MSYLRLSGKAALRNVVLPVFLGPHKKADCPFGSLIFSNRGIICIMAVTPF
jgi:hypothetical protein